MSVVSESLEAKLRRTRATGAEEGIGREAGSRAKMGLISYRRPPFRRPIQLMSNKIYLVNDGIMKYAYHLLLSVAIGISTVAVVVWQCRPPLLSNAFRELTSPSEMAFWGLVLAGAGLVWTGSLALFCSGLEIDRHGTVNSVCQCMKFGGRIAVLWRSPRRDEKCVIDIRRASAHFGYGDKWHGWGAFLCFRDYAMMVVADADRKVVDQYVSELRSHVDNLVIAHGDHIGGHV